MHIYLETAPGSNILKYRGETSETDEPDSFARKMGENGLIVQSHKKHQGDKIILGEK